MSGESMILSLLTGIAVPGLVSAALLSLIARPWQEEAPARRAGSALWAFSLAVAYLSGHVVVAGVPPFPPLDAGQWFFYFVPLAAALAAAESLQKAPEILVRLPRAALLYGLFYLTFRPLVDMTWGRMRGSFIILLLSLLALSLWQALAELGRRVSAGAFAGSLLGAAAGAAAALLLSGSALLAQLGGVLASALGPAAILALWRPGRSPAAALAAPWVVVLSVLLAQGVYYSELPPGCALILLGAPLLCGLELFAPVSKLSARTAAILSGAAALAASAGCAIYLALHAPPGSY